MRPDTRRDEVVDVLHGVEVRDPYRWLEDTDDPDVRQWVAAQNEYSRKALDALPDRAMWHERLVALMRQPVIEAIQVRGDVVITRERLADADQSVLAARRLSASAADPTVLVDPTVGGDPTAAVDWFEASPDGALVAYGASTGGTERSTLRIVATANGNHLDEAIAETRACSVAWEPDGAGFFYTRYPTGDEYHRTVHRHQLGDDPAIDPVVWAEHPAPEAWPSVDLSDDGRWLLVHVERGWSSVDVHLLDRQHGRWMTLIEDAEVESRFVFAADGASLIGSTTLDASNGRIVKVALPSDGAEPALPEHWATVVAEREGVVSVPRVAGDELWLVVTTVAVDTIERRSATGELLGTFDGLGVVNVLGLATDRHRGVGLILVNGFDRPPTVWSAATGADQLTAWWSGDIRVDPPALEVRHVRYPSTDTEIGLFLIHRADITPGAATPTILNGYGGFAIAETPVWSAQIAAWCEAGGLYAVAGLRGGLEHGEAWHLAGNRANKQNVFDDFAAAGDWLVGEGLTSRDRLAIVGRSNGGLLVGATLTQRPDLCRAVWCGVPLLDMIRFAQFLIARLWTPEYGDPDIAEEFAWLQAYSPYHHVVADTCYPATLFTCAEGDSRVHPLHARKMTALLQERTACGDDHPVLLIEERAAGHGVGKPVTMRAAELADALTFLSWQLGWEPPALDVQ